MSKELFDRNILQNKNGLEKYLSSIVILGIILILGTALRFYDLGSESFWLDEVATTIEAQQSIPTLLTTGKLDQPPAYYLPIHFWIQLFGTSEVSLRSFSALAGVGSIILIYIIGKKLFGKKIGLLATFFLAISDFQIWYAQEARNYSLFEFAALLSFLFFIMFFEGNRKIHFFLYVVASIFMVYANAFGICIIAAQGLFLILQIGKRRKLVLTWISGQVLIFFAIIPYFYPLVFGSEGIEGTIVSNLTGLAPTTFSDVLRSIYRFILPPRRFFGDGMEWGKILLAIYAIAGIFLVVGTLLYVIRQGVGNWLIDVKKIVDNLLEIPDVKTKALLVSCWLLCPPLLLFFVSKLISPVYEHRYVISAAPALYLLLALVLFSIRKVVPLSISVGVLMILIIPGLSYYYVADVKEQWKEVAAFIEDNADQNEVLVFAPNDSSVNTGNQLKAFNYYYQGTLPSCGIGPDELTDAEVWKALKQCISNHDRFWVIVRHTTYTYTAPYDRYELFFLDTNKATMKLITEKHFYNISAYLLEMK
jgi:mannosyltransferase